MKLATLRDGTRDGHLLVVDSHGRTMREAPAPWLTLQKALEDWRNAEGPLLRVFHDLNAGALPGTEVEVERLAAPLPRTHEWLDGSAYLNHVRLARQARGAADPPGLLTDPLMYQGGGSDMLGPRDPFHLLDPAWGLDFEAELAVIVADVPVGASPRQAEGCVRLLTLLNDWTLRNLVPAELAKGFGFVQSKPATAFAPFAITPDELGPLWRHGRAHVEVHCQVDGHTFGRLPAGAEMQFSFGDLIAHATRTRRLEAGAIIGGGTVSSTDVAAGVACLAERRARETLDHGAPRTEFLRVGNRVRIEAFAGKSSPFGAFEGLVI